MSVCVVNQQLPSEQSIINIYHVYSCLTISKLLRTLYMHCTLPHCQRWYNLFNPCFVVRIVRSRSKGPGAKPSALMNCVYAPRQEPSELKNRTQAQDSIYITTTAHPVSMRLFLKPGWLLTSDDRKQGVLWTSDDRDKACICSHEVDHPVRTSGMDGGANIVDIFWIRPIEMCLNRKCKENEINLTRK